MPELEEALRDLEIATAALVEVSGEDLGHALERRSKAIARVADLKSAMLALPPAGRDEILQRLRYASGAGELAQLRLAGSKRKATAEWRQWNQIYRSLGGGTSLNTRKIDCSG